MADDDMARIGQIHDVLRAVCTTEFMSDFFPPMTPGGPPMYGRCSEACMKIVRAVNDQLQERSYTCICAIGEWTDTPSSDFLQTAMLRDVTKAKATVGNILEHNWIVIGKTDSSFNGNCVRPNILPVQRRALYRHEDNVGI